MSYCKYHYLANPFEFFLIQIMQNSHDSKE
jgi:hypothetical protein